MITYILHRTYIGDKNMARTNISTNQAVKTYTTPIKLPDGFVLNNRGFFSIVVNEESVNYFINPEVFDLTGFGGGATKVLDSERQWIGNNSLNVNFLFGQFLTAQMNIVVPPNTPYTWSFSAIGNGSYRVYVADAANTQISAAKIITVGGFWQRYDYTFTDQLGTGNKLVIESLGYSEANFDGFQLEGKPYATTFISGNLDFPAYQGIRSQYYWLGSQNNSFSVRDASTNSGGRVYPLEYFGLDVLGFENLGSTEFEHTITQLAYGDRAYYRCSRPKNREFTILGQISDCSMLDVMCKRFGLVSALSPFRNITQQPIKLLFQMYDCDEPISECFELDVIYNGGLEGSYKSINGERIALDFIMANSAICECKTNTVTLDTIDTIDFGATPYGAVLSYNSTGVLTQLTDNYVPPHDIEQNDGIIAPNGSLFTTGYFSVNNTGIQSVLAEFNGNTWVDRVSVVAGIQRGNTIVNDGNNNIYFGGQFTTATDGNGNQIVPLGAAAYVNVGRYSLTTNNITRIGTVGRGLTLGGSVQRMVPITVNNRQLILVAGDFDRAIQNNGVVVPAINIAAYDPATDTWDSLNGLGQRIFGAVSSGIVLAMLYDNTNTLWLGGAFDGAAPSNDYTLANNYKNVVRVDLLADTILPTDQLVRGGSGQLSVLTTTISVLQRDIVYDIIQRKNGSIVAVGRFDSAGRYETASISGTLPASLPERPVNIAVFSSNRWRSHFSVMTVSRAAFDLFSPTIGVIYDIYESDADELWVSGQFDYIGPMYFNGYRSTNTQWAGTYALANYQINASGYAKTVGNSAAWIPVALTSDSTNNTVGTFVVTGGLYGNSNYQQIVAGSPGTSLLSFPPGYSGSIFYGGTFSGQAYSRDAAIITLDCTLEVKPIFNVTGPATIQNIENSTTGQVISFDKGLTLQENEVLTIDLTGIRPNISTTLQGSILKMVSSSSSLLSFRLVNGDNVFRVRYLDVPAIDNPLLPFPVVRLTWQNCYPTIDAACGSCGI